MREEQRLLAQRKLDKELRLYRRAGKEKHPTQKLLRTVRQALGGRGRKGRGSWGGTAR